MSIWRLGNWLSQGLRLAYAYMQGHDESYRPEDETFSSYTGKRWLWDRSAAWGRWYSFINWLFKDPEHCRNAIEWDRGYRAERPPIDWRRMYGSKGRKISDFDIKAQGGDPEEEHF